MQQIVQHTVLLKLASAFKPNLKDLALITHMSTVVFHEKRAHFSPLWPLAELTQPCSETTVYSFPILYCMCVCVCLRVCRERGSSRHRANEEDSCFLIGPALKQC